MQTIKIKNLILKVVEVENGFGDNYEMFENLVCKDGQGRFYHIGLSQANFNFGKYKVGDIFLVKSARCFTASPSLNFLYYVRINHKKY